MTEQEKKELKEKLQEEKQYRKLQKAIASLPQPSFNNPEKVQPAKQVSVPTVITASMKGKGASVSPDVKSTKIVDIPDILDTNTTRIERVAKIRRNKKQSVILRALSYMKKEWFLLVLAIFFCFANSIFECLIPLIIGDGIDFIVGPNEVNFAMVSKYIIYLSLCIVGFAVFKWLTSRYLLCKHISGLIRQTHCSCHISHCLLCRKCAKGRNLRHMVRAVFLHNVINNTLSALHAEIYIEVRHRNSFGIEKTLKEQIIFQRIYTRYAYAISAKASCT